MGGQGLGNANVSTLLTNPMGNITCPPLLGSKRGELSSCSARSIPPGTAWLIHCSAGVGCNCNLITSHWAWRVKRTNRQINVNAIAHLKCTFTTREILQRHFQSARISPGLSPGLSDVCHSSCFSDSSAKRHSGLQNVFGSIVVGFIWRGLIPCQSNCQAQATYWLHCEFEKRGQNMGLNDFSIHAQESYKTTADEKLTCELHTHTVNTISVMYILS